MWSAPFKLALIDVEAKAKLGFVQGKCAQSLRNYGVWASAVCRRRFLI